MAVENLEKKRAEKYVVFGEAAEKGRQQAQTLNYVSL